MISKNAPNREHALRAALLANESRALSYANAIVSNSIQTLFSGSASVDSACPFVSPLMNISRLIRANFG